MNARQTWTAVAIASIWLAVAVRSVFAPDIVPGSEQEHLPIAAMTNWFWGLLSTAFVLVPLAVHHRERRAPDQWWFLLAAATISIWLAVTLVSILAPVQVSGAEAERTPIGAILSPVVATFAMGFVAGFVTVLSRDHDREAEERR